MGPFTYCLILAALAGAAFAQTPSIAANGVLHGATLTRANLAPGGLVTIFGEGLAGATMVAPTDPAPLSLSGVSVTFDGRPGAILYLSPTQINVQAPWSVLEPGQTSRLTAISVTRDGRASAPVSAMFGVTSPGVFTLNGSGTGMAVAMNAADGSYAQPAGAIVGAVLRAARIGSVITLYGTGLGPVNPSVSTGQVSRDLVRRSRMPPEVLIGGRQAEVLFAGLSADLPGVHQINAIVPAGIAAGNAVPVQVQMGGTATSERVTIAIDGATEPSTPLPGADAAALWSYLDRLNFRQNFPLIPGKDQLYSGIAPHTQLLTVLINPTAREALERKPGSMPAGSIIIKDVHGPGGTRQTTLVMYKIPGFDPANGDWYWSMRGAGGAVGMSGSLAGCYGCHTRSLANDLLFLASPAPAPAPNAAAVRDFVANQNYRETWRRFPGSTPNQPSAAPHGATVSVYLNEAAYNAIENGEGRMPAGAVIIKENFMPDRSLAALTVMLKSPGFDAANNDWFWLMQLPDGSAAASGKVDTCNTCHVRVKDNDYIYLASLHSRPEPQSRAVWNFVSSQDYQKKWRLWPGTTAQMPGNAPHGALITTYVNDAAWNAINSRRGTMPAGAIVVKENYMPDRVLAAVTLMYKSPGFDPDRNDWFWMQRLAGGTVPAEGRVAGCANCHALRQSNDYLYAGPLR